MLSNSKNRKTEIYAFQKKLYRLAEPVQVFWGQSMKISVSDNSEAPSFTWEDINISMKYRDSSDNDLTCSLLHEWGHRCIAPESTAIQIWWQILARMEGIEADHVAVNIAADLIVDSWYLKHPDWKELYLESYTNSYLKDCYRPTEYINPLFCFLLNCRSALVGLDEELPERLRCAGTTKAMSYLFNLKLTQDQNIRLFFRILAPFLKYFKTPDSRGSKGDVNSNGTFGLQPISWKPSAWDAEALVKLLSSRGIKVPDTTLNNVCGEKIANRVTARLRVLESLIQVMPSVDRFVENGKQTISTEYEFWKIGDSIRKLDPLRTLERAGSILPGINTLGKRNLKNNQNESENPVLCLIIDDSSSTNGQIMRQQLNASIALLETARKTRKPASLIVFGSHVTTLIKPGQEYQRMEMIIASLQSQSGGTRLAPALTEALRFIPNNGEKMATVVFTDSYLFDIEESISLIPRLMSAGPVALFCTEDRLDDSLVGSLKKLKKSPAIIQVAPNTQLVDAALRILL
jgi:hypothetical protein